MQSHQREKQRSSDAVQTSFTMSRDLLEVVDRSADHNGLTRSAEISRLIIIALEKGRCDSEPETGEITGHIV